MITAVTFKDIFKSSFTENIASFSVMDTAIAMVLAFCVGLFIFMSIKKHLMVFCIQQALVCR